MKHLPNIGVVCLATVGILSAASAQADTVTYTNQASFVAQLSASITDGYDDAVYGAGFHVYTNAQMNAFFGQTQYVTTGHVDNNVIAAAGTFAHSYCAGCNGSFTLGFQNTSFTTGGGVFGVGFAFFNSGTPAYNAFVTFGDGSTANFLLPSVPFTSPAYFGITSDLEIASIAIGLPNGGTTQSGNFAMDNLTIGSAAAAVPGPVVGAGLPGLVMAFGGFLAWRRRKAALAA